MFIYIYIYIYIYVYNTHVEMTYVDKLSSYVETKV